MDVAPTNWVNLNKALKNNGEINFHVYKVINLYIHAAWISKLILVRNFMMFYYCCSFTVNEEGGCFHVPVASAILVFPPAALWVEKTLTCSRVKYSDCKVNPREGEFFVSRILKIKPEGMVFDKPATVLLSHSLYEDQNFLDFYELVIENVSPAGLQELKTERISSIKGMDSNTCYHYMKYSFLNTDNCKLITHVGRAHTPSSTS